MTINVVVNNFSLVALPSVSVAVYDGDPDDTASPGTQIGTDQKISLGGWNSTQGSTKTLSWQWTPTKSQHAIYATLTVAGGEEITTVNNKGFNFWPCT